MARHSRIGKSTKDALLDAAFEEAGPDADPSPLDELRKDRNLQRKDSRVVTAGGNSAAFGKRILSMPAPTTNRTESNNEHENEAVRLEALNRLKRIEKRNRNPPRLQRPKRATEDGASSPKRISNSNSHSNDEDNDDDNVIGPQSLKRNDRAVSLPVRSPRRVNSSVRPNASHPDFGSRLDNTNNFSGQSGVGRAAVAAGGGTLATLRESGSAPMATLDGDQQDSSNHHQQDKPVPSPPPRLLGPKRIESTVRPNASHPDFPSPNEHDRTKKTLVPPDRSLSMPVKGLKRIESTVRSNAAHPDFDSVSEATRRLQMIEQGHRGQRSKDDKPLSARTVSMPARGPRRIESTVRTPGCPDLQSPIVAPKKKLSSRRPNADQDEEPAPLAPPPGRSTSAPVQSTTTLPSRFGPRRVESTIRPNANHPDFKTIGNGSEHGSTGRGNDKNKAEGKVAKPPPTAAKKKEKTNGVPQKTGFMGRMRSRKENGKPAQKDKEHRQQDGQPKKPKPTRSFLSMRRKKK